MNKLTISRGAKRLKRGTKVMHRRVDQHIATVRLGLCMERDIRRVSSRRGFLRRFLEDGPIPVYDIKVKVAVTKEGLE